MDILKVYEQQKNAVFRLALTYLHSVSDAEDVCHDAFMKLIEHQNQILSGKERAWLATVTSNLCKNRLRLAKRRQEEPLTEDLPLPAPEDTGVYEAVMSLPVGERTVVYLYYYEGYATAEIATIQEISRTAVTTRLERARKHLKNRLEVV